MNMNNNNRIQLENVTYLGRGIYITTVSAKLIAELLNNQTLSHNKKIRPKAVGEIKELLLKDKLITTELAFNVEHESSKDENLVYDDKQKTLALNNGIKLSIRDGVQRCIGALQAVGENSYIDFNFVVQIHLNAINEKDLMKSPNLSLNS